MEAHAVSTYVNRHVEVVGLEVVGHLSEALQGVLPDRLLKPKRFPGFTALLQGGRQT